MTLDDFLKLVKAMKSIWTAPNFLPDSYSVKTWYALLQDIPYEELNVAVQSCAMTCKFPPTIADLRSAIVENRSTNSTWGDAWADVVKKIGHYGMYQELEALEHMDELTRKAVKSIGWKQLCMSENADVVRGQFRNAYEQAKTEKTEHDKLPQHLKDNIAMIQNKVLMIGE